MKQKRRFVTLILTVCLLFSTTITVYATSVDSNVKTTGTINGYAYKIMSSLSTAGALGVCASGDVRTVSGTAPAGYMGVDARVVNTNGAVKASTGISYSDSATSMWVLIGAYYNATGTFGSQCMAYFYNGNGYTAYQSFRSPYINWTKKSSLSGQLSEDDYQYPVNENNDTYGSVLYSEIVGEEPDLILVENESGQTGYVKKEELDRTFSSPEEAVAWTKSHTAPYAIPMYDDGGITVIGEFMVTPGTGIAK